MNSIKSADSHLVLRGWRASANVTAGRYLDETNDAVHFVSKPEVANTRTENLLTELLRVALLPKRITHLKQPTKLVGHFQNPDEYPYRQPGRESIMGPDDVEEKQMRMTVHIRTHGASGPRGLNGKGPSGKVFSDYTFEKAIGEVPNV